MTLSLTRARCHCSRPADFILQSWPDGVVVYDDASASLQVLNPVAGEAFELMRKRGQFDAESLAKDLVQADPAPEDIELVAGLLTQFEAMGWIECSKA